MVWRGDIRYGDYFGVEWHSLSGWDDLLFQLNLSRVLECSSLFGGYNLYVVGGLLEGWVTWDVDWVLTGPYDPVKIRLLLDFIVGLGFDIGVYPDVNYCVRHVGVSELVRRGESCTYDVYELSDKFERNGVCSSVSYEFVDGLYRRSVTYPSWKQLWRIEGGHVYRDPRLVLAGG